MKNREYWQQRFEILEQAQMDKAERYAETLDLEYRRASANVQKEIESWYQRIAVNNDVSIAEARRLLSTQELAELKWSVGEYINYGRENALNQRWVKQLENASARAHISRLEALQLQLQQQAEVLFGNQLDGIDRLARDIYKDGYYRTAFEVQRGFNVGWDLAAVDNRRLDRVLSNPWTTDDRTFRDRCWTQKQQLIGTLQTEQLQALMRGDPPDQVIKRIAHEFNVSRNRAARLVMTESAYFASAAQKDAFNELDVERYEIVATLDLHTSEICQGLDGHVEEMKNYEAGVTAPPFHPWCRSTTVPYFDDDFGERAARRGDGETYYVPADMTYPHWYSKYITPNEITKYDQEVLIRYIGGGSYRLNAKLRDDVPLSRSERDWVDRLNLALSKMPDYVGDIQRSIHIGSEASLTNFVSAHRLGDTVKYPAFSSFSKLDDYNPDANIQMFVVSQRGKDISLFNIEEQEILYPTDSRFLVKGHWVDGEVHNFVLEEV